MNEYRVCTFSGGIATDYLVKATDITQAIYASGCFLSDVTKVELIGPSETYDYRERD